MSAGDYRVEYLAREICRLYGINPEAKTLDHTKVEKGSLGVTRLKAGAVVPEWRVFAPIIEQLLGALDVQLSRSDRRAPSSPRVSAGFSNGAGRNPRY